MKTLTILEFIPLPDCPAPAPVEYVEHVEHVAPPHPGRRESFLILDYGVPPYSIEAELKELPGGVALFHVVLPDGYLGLVFSPEERRSWVELSWRVGETVDAWHAENGPPPPQVFTQGGLRYQLQTYAHNRIQINETPPWR